MAAALQPLPMAPVRIQVRGQWVGHRLMAAAAAAVGMKELYCHEALVLRVRRLIY